MTAADPLAGDRAGDRHGRTTLPERESLERLAAAGVPVTPFIAVPLDADAAVAAWRAMGGGPVALKLDAVGLAHKTEAGAVLLGLADEAAIRDAVAVLARSRARAAASGPSRSAACCVEPMAPAGVEIIVGGRRDAVFGPAVLVGLGGIFTEVLDDVAVLLAPVDADVVRARLERLAGCGAPAGRSRPAGGRHGYASVVRGAVARFLVDNPGVLEVDLNPVMAGPGGAVAVDALVISGGAS